MTKLDQYTIQDIVEYFDVDTRLIMQRINKNIITEIIGRADPDQQLHIGACCCSTKLVDYAISKGATDLIGGMYAACGFYSGSYTCCDGSINIINLLIDKGITKLDSLFPIMCEHGNLDVINIMIQHGCNNWNVGLGVACFRGYLDIINLMIDKGALDWNRGMRCACPTSNLDIVNMMILKGANDWNGGLQVACSAGSRELINLMIEKGATECDCGKSIIEHKTMDTENRLTWGYINRLLYTI